MLCSLRVSSKNLSVHAVTNFPQVNSQPKVLNTNSCTSLSRIQVWDSKMYVTPGPTIIKLIVKLFYTNFTQFIFFSNTTNITIFKF